MRTSKPALIKISDSQDKTTRCTYGKGICVEDDDERGGGMGKRVGGESEQNTQ